jgi:hypothetical protein
MSYLNLCLILIFGILGVVLAGRSTTTSSTSLHHQLRQNSLSSSSSDSEFTDGKKVNYKQ